MNIKKLLKENGIRARVLTQWNDAGSKFMERDWAKPRGRNQLVGEVVAVSTTDGKRIRSESRGWTRYYLKFSDGGIRGYFSNELVHAA